MNSSQRYRELGVLRRQRDVWRLERDFAEFCKWAWPILHPGEELIWSWAYDFWCEHLTLVATGRLLRLIGNTPPRFLKSTLTSIFWPCWIWTTRPWASFLCASYSMDLSVEHNIARRNLISSHEYQNFWRHKFQLSSDRNLTTEFANTQHAGMIATATNARTMGKGGDYIIGDDLMSADQALSDAERKTANTWIEQTLLQRLNNPATAAVVVICQRLHQMDTTGFLLESQPGRWKHIKLALVAEENETWQFPISGRVVKRSRGDVLQPVRFPTSTVAEIQARRYVYASQYQQEPSPLEGNLIKRADVRYYGGIDRITGAADEALPSQFDRKIISCDASFKDLNTSDYVAIGVIGVKGRKRYLLNVVNARLDAAATEAEIRRQRALHGPISATLIEDKANGPAVIGRLKQNISGVVAINPQGGKIARMFAAAPEWQAGDWLVDRTAAWTEPFVEQITMVPYARNDDMADMMSQAAVWLQQNTVNYCVVAEFYELQRRQAWAELANPSPGQEIFTAVGAHGEKLQWDPRRELWVDTKTGETFEAGPG